MDDGATFSRPSSRILSHTLLAQSLYYLITGLWPLVNMPAFIAITGPKTDVWLVQTVALMITVMGGAMFFAAIKRRVTPEIAILAVGGIVGLTLIDIVYVAEGVISPVYLLDAAVEIILLGFWYLGWRSRKFDLEMRKTGKIIPAHVQRLEALDADETEGIIQH